MKYLLMSTAILAATGLPVAAQQTQPAQTENAAPAEQQQAAIEASSLIGKRLLLPPMMGEAGPATSADATPQTADGSQEPVFDPSDWRTAALIDDVLLTPEGSVRGLVVDAGGLLGAQDWSRVIDINNVRIASNPEWADDFYVIYFGDERMLSQSLAYDSAQVGASGLTLGTQRWDGSMLPAYREITLEDLQADVLLGATVYGDNGNWVGEIHDFTLTEDGAIDDMIVDVGGFLGIGEKPVALSMDEVTLRLSNMRNVSAYVTATEDELDDMQRWTNDAG